MQFRGKSDSGVMFYLHHYQGFIIDRSLVYRSPADRFNTRVIYRLELDQVKCTCTSYFLLSNCKHNITSLSLLAGTTVTSIQSHHAGLEV